MSHRNKVASRDRPIWATQLLRQQTVSLGPRVQWDSRDSVFYPKRAFLDANMDFFSRAWEASGAINITK